MMVAGHLRPAFSCLVDMLGLVVDLATDLTFQHGCIDEDWFGQGIGREKEKAQEPYAPRGGKAFLRDLLLIIINPENG